MPQPYTSPTTGGLLDLTAVVTCTVFWVDGGTRTSRRPVSLPSIERARTMHTTGCSGILPGDGDRDVDGLVVDQAVAAEFALDRTAEPPRGDDRDRHPDYQDQRGQPTGDQAALSAGQPLPSVARGGTLDHLVFMPVGRMDLQNWNYRTTRNG